MISRVLLIWMAALLASCGGSVADYPGGSAETRNAVEVAIREIDQMRSGLASGISVIESVSEETFAEVCKPVGMRMKRTAQETGWRMGQVAVKYRNRANAPDADASVFYNRFESDARRDSLWFRTEVDAAPGWRYLRRITVERPCLACHGEKEKRPEFVKANYPDDSAYGFEEGDLRGLYSVFVPDAVQKESEE